MKTVALFLVAAAVVAAPLTRASDSEIQCGDFATYWHCGSQSATDADPSVACSDAIELLVAAMIPPGPPVYPPDFPPSLNRTPCMTCWTAEPYPGGWWECQATVNTYSDISIALTQNPDGTFTCVASYCDFYDLLCAACSDGPPWQ